MKKNKPKQVFECITERQEYKIQALFNTSEKFDQVDFDALLTSCSGLPMIGLLSKQEASFIIGKLSGENTRKEPFPPRYEERIKENAQLLPLVVHIYFIRESIKSLEWSEESFNRWLRSYIQADSIRELDREKASKVYRRLVKLREYRLSSGRLPDVFS